MTILNTAAYRFLSLSDNCLPDLKKTLYHHATTLGIKGTILLSPEGINFSLAGTPAAITQFKESLKDLLPALDQMHYNESESSYQPFQNLFVKIKKQIIPYSDKTILPEKHTAPYVTPETLREWLKTHRDIVLLDTRNQYEVEVGSFENTLSLDLKHFRDFPIKAATLPESLKKKVIVTFCTGGIRCEKAAATLLQQKFKTVYQLQGGILSYFQRCGQQYYRGDCFVFDEREAINASDIHKTS